MERDLTAMMKQRMIRQAGRITAPFLAKLNTILVMDNRGT